jgi:hypothetical protein
MPGDSGPVWKCPKMAQRIWTAPALVFLILVIQVILQLAGMVVIVGQFWILVTYTPESLWIHISSRKSTTNLLSQDFKQFCKTQRIVMVTEMSQQKCARMPPCSHQMDGETQKFLLVGDLLCSMILHWFRVAPLSNIHHHFDIKHLCQKGCKLRFWVACESQDAWWWPTLQAQLLGGRSLAGYYSAASQETKRIKSVLAWRYVQIICMLEKSNSLWRSLFGHHTTTGVCL